MSKKNRHIGMDGMTFGMRIRAARLGFGVARSGFLMRISGDDAPFLIELLPAGYVPNNLKTNTPHRVWWEDPGIIDDIVPLRGVVKVKKPISFRIGSDGRLAA